MLIYKQAAVFKIMKIINASVIYTAFLSPWIKIFERGNASGLDFTFLVGSGVADPSSIYNFLDFLWYLLGVIIFTGLGSVILFASDGMIYAIFNRQLLKNKIRTTLLILSFTGTTISGVLLYLAAYIGGTSRISGIAIGYWLCLLGQISILVIEILENHSKQNLVS